MDLKATLIDLQCELVAERSLANPKDISWLQYDVLYHLNREGEMLPSDLSLILGITRPKLSKALKGLKSMGYVEQYPNKLDGRELYTSLTTSGKELLQNISQKHSSLYHLALESFSKDEQEEFAILSSKLSDRLRKARLKIDG